MKTPLDSLYCPFRFGHPGFTQSLLKQPSNFERAACSVGIQLSISCQRALLVQIK